MDPRSSNFLGTALLVVGALVAGMLGGSSTGTAPTSCDALATVAVTGHVRDERLDEISGITTSSLGPDVLWAVEDSGNDAAVFAVRTDGEIEDRVAVEGSTNVDWEDLARDDGRLWVGDVGDNDAARSSVQIYWFDEPDAAASVVQAKVLTLRYPDGPRNAEGMLVAAGRLYVFEKQAVRPRSRVYAVDLGELGAETERRLELVGSVDMRLITGAALGPDGIALATYTGTRFFPWAGDVPSTLARSPCPVPLFASEAVTFSSDGRWILSIPEGVNPPISSAGGG